MSEILEVLLDALLDALKLFPFMLLIYILIELMEHATSAVPRRLKGSTAPLLGAATGLIPQCGFSVMAAKLYDRGLIRTGTLLAVFLSTSDEAFIILLSSGTGALSLIWLILVKFVVSVLVGYLVNFILSKREKIGEGAEELEEHSHSCGRRHANTPWHDYFFSPLAHASLITLYIFLVNVAFGLLYYFVGEENVMSFLAGTAAFQPIVATLVGLIPNCASSVVLTQSYLIGGITFGSCVAGLCANAGMGLVVLLKNTKKIKRNLLLISTICVTSIVVGYVINLVLTLL
ncbi:MAG: putative manganese transporter [Christensenellaceae bacterium]